jgi:alanine racemase
VLCHAPPPPDARSVPCVVVPDTQRALTDWARFVVRKYRPRVVGITGSTGKTSAREAIAAVLARRYAVFRNPANFNGRFGLPIALAGLGDEHEFAVLELACDSFGEIAHLADLTRPQIGVVTAVNHAHLAYLKNLEAIAQEKGRLVEALPADGVAVLNYDDPRVRAMRHRTAARVLTYGLDAGADLLGADVVPGPMGLDLTVRLAPAAQSGLPKFPSYTPVHVGLIGRHHAHTTLAAIAVGLVAGVTWEEIAAGLRALRPSPGRLNPLAGIGGARILDDTYSASPASMLAALRALADQPADRRIAVLGGMAQLGDYAAEGHRRVGEAAAACVDLLITQGERGAWSARAAEAVGFPPEAVRGAYTAADVVRLLRDELGAGDAVLVKGDVEARMERVVRGLLADPAQDAAQLVRQAPESVRVRAARPARPTWVDIDLEAIAVNVRHVKALVGPSVELLAVVKANAYGHGAPQVAHTAINSGATYCGVASLNEAVALRAAGVDAPILILGYTPAWLAREALLQDVTVTLYDPDVARAFSRAAVDLRRRARAHVKVDTGMGRLGLLPDRVLPFVREVGRLPGLALEGIFTHFSVADAEDLDYTRWQLARFQGVLERLAEAGVAWRYVHAANSAALLRLPAARFDMVRLGIAMYGLPPAPQVPLPAGFRPAMSWRTTVAQVKTLPPGSYVSYGNTYRTAGAETIAVIPVGYADGFRRAPTRWREVLVRGRRAPIVGRVCMDQTMIRVDHVPGVRVGDEVVLIGAQGDDAITADEVADWLGTINYEVVSEILARVPRRVT